MVVLEDFVESVEQADIGGHCTLDDTVGVLMEESATSCIVGQHQVDEKTDKESMTNIPI